MTQTALRSEAGKGVFSELAKKVGKLLDRYKEIDGKGHYDYLLGIQTLYDLLWLEVTEVAHNSDYDPELIEMTQLLVRIRDYNLVETLSHLAQNKKLGDKFMDHSHQYFSTAYDDINTKFGHLRNRTHS
jgi:hypothetical protein